jgi:hypothetical protein
LGITTMIVPLFGVAVMLALLQLVFPLPFVSIEFISPLSSAMLPLLALKDICCTDLFYLFPMFNA